MLNRSIIDQMDAILSRLCIPVAITEQEQLDHDLAVFAGDLAEGVPTFWKSRIYLKTHLPQVLLSCDNVGPGSSDILILAEALIASLGDTDTHAESTMDIYRKILCGDISGSDLELVQQEHHIPDKLRRCVLLFRMTGPGHGKAFDLLKDIVPITGSDILIDLDRYNAVLIKDATELDATDDMIEYADALKETLISETAQ